MKFKHFLMAFVICFVMGVGIYPTIKASAVTQNENIQIVSSDSEILSTDYLEFYAVSSSLFTYSNNGGELSSNKLSYAFDRNFSTSFKSSQDNNVSYTDPETGEVTENFINYIDVSFSKAVTLDRILYASENGTTRGFPTILNLYYDNGNGFELIREYNTSETTNFVIFELGKNVEMTKFRFEYVKVSTRHKYVASAKEILFLQPESDDYETYKNIFTDYAETVLNEKINTVEKLTGFEKSLAENVNFQIENPKIERAKKVAEKEILFNQNFEFSTNPNSKKVIERYGDLANYCRNTLQLSSFGTNRQVIGVLGYAGDEITIYVTGNSDDPLPKIRFAQHVGSWQSWIGGEQQLKLGKNTFTVPNFYQSDSYLADVPLGGPIYIVNPYTSSEQSENVKIYIEGGSLYPIYNKNIDEDTYLSELEDYCKLVESDPENVINITEIVSDHTFVTVYATNAKTIYKTMKPSKTISNWNEYMDKLLNFAGIYQDESNELFDSRNLVIRTNLRVTQVWPSGWMFAAGEHVGVRETSQNVLIYGSGFGWGVSHELGHALDNKNRVISETSNNMWAKFNETAIEQANTRGNFAQTLSVLSNDLTYDENDFFVNVTLNYLVWWYIETWQDGYWGNLENCYRGFYPKLNEFYAKFPAMKEKANTLAPTELQVFYSSIVTGVDLSYYFDRWGYSVRKTEADPVFKVDTASSTFNEIMSTAISNGYVDDSKQYKLWYQNYMAYHNKNKTPIYSNSTTVSIKTVAKLSTGYNIFINHTERENHLGYEIWAGDEINGFNVIGFTYTNTYLDLTNYENGYVPSYKIVAYDNTYSSSKISEAKTIVDETEIVCKIGETFYTSLADAILNASAGDEIKLLKSFSSVNLVIAKNLTIKLDESTSTNLVISKIESGNLLTVSSGVTLKICGNSNYYLVFDGNGFSQNGSLLSVGGVVQASYVIFENSISTSSGGAILMQGSSKGSTFTNCIFRKNSATSGSVYYCDYANSNATFTNSQVSNNTSTGDGIISSKGTLTLTNVEIKNNTAKNGIVKNYAGGILYATNCNVSENIAEIGAGFHIDGYTKISGGIISLNSASIKAGGIFYSTTVAVRQLLLENVEFSQNISPVASDFVIAGGIVTFNGVKTYSGSTICIASGSAKIQSNSSLCSNIEIYNGANVIIVNGLFENISQSKFILTNFADGMKVLSAENYTFTVKNLSNISIDLKNTTLNLVDNIIYANSVTQPVITINIDGTNTILKLDYLEKFVLDFEVSSTKFIEKYVDDNGTEYAVGSTIVANKDMNLTAVVKNKIKIEFDFEGDVETYYYLPNENIEFPVVNNENIRFLGWKNSNNLYNNSDVFVATEDLTFVASYVNLYTLIVKNGISVIYEKVYEDGTIVDLSKLEITQPDYYTLNGEKLQGTKITMSKDFVIVAEYVAKYKLTVKSGNQTIFEKEYESGTIVDLSKLEITQPDYYTLNGERLQGTKITMSKDFVIVAEYIAKYKLTVKSGNQTIFEKEYESGTIVDLSKLEITQPDYYTLNGEKLQGTKIIMRENKTIIAEFYQVEKTDKLPIVIISSVVSIIFISIVVIIVCKKRK